MAHRSASSAEQRYAVPCPAVRCGTVRCCDVLRAVLYLFFRACQVSFGIIQQYQGTPHQVVRTALMNHIKCSQLSSAQLLLSSAKGSAVRCRAVPCGAVPCPAVWCRAASYGAVRCRDMPCDAVLCGAVRCSAVLRAVLHISLSYAPGPIRRSIMQPYPGTPHQICTYHIVEPH